MADSGCERGKEGAGLGFREIAARDFAGRDPILELVERRSALVRVRAGRALYYQGDEGQAAFLLIEGRIRPMRLRGSSTITRGELLVYDLRGLRSYED